MGRLAPRKPLVRLELSGARRAEAYTIGGPRSYTVEEYNIDLEGILYQEPPSAEVTLAPKGLLLNFSLLPWEPVCRWHNGPLEGGDDPRRRLYCPAPASGGYCRQHKRSLRALYEACMGGGFSSLEYCKAVDREVRNEYIIYLAWWPSKASINVKVGVTRKHRLLERLAEQPHLAATELTVFDRLYEARKAEMIIAREGIARQHTRKTGLGTWGLSKALVELEAAAERASRLLGVEWHGRLVRIKPPEAPLGISPVESSRLAGSKMVLAGYWGGMLILRTLQGSSLALARSSDILHRKSLNGVYKD